MGISPLQEGTQSGAQPLGTCNWFGGRQILPHITALSSILINLNYGQCVLFIAASDRPYG